MKSGELTQVASVLLRFTASSGESISETGRDLTSRPAYRDRTVKFHDIL
jgi:hypothetical protein